MANVKFFKGAIPANYAKYVPGGIYFDETTHEIRVGSGTEESASYKAFGSHVKDAVMKDSVLTISYNDGKANVVLDFSDVASASDVNVSFKALADKIAALEAAKPVKGDDIKIGDDNSINVNIKDAITVAGGPLADDTTDNWPSDWKDTAGNRIIPADKSLTDILTGLFLKETNGTLETPSYTWNPSVGAPTITMGDSNTLIEVNTVLKPTFTANSSVSGNTASVRITSTQGYFLNNDAAWKSGTYSKSVTGTTTGAAACTATWNGAAITSGGNATIKLGTNTLNVSESGLTASVAAFAADTLYASTNTKKKLDSVKTSVNTTYFSATPKPLTSSASATRTGVYPCATNLGHLGTDTVEKIKLQTSNVFYVSVPAHNSSDFRFYYPNGWTVSTFKVKSLDGKYYDFSANYNKNAGNVSIAVGGTNTTYHYLSVNNGASDYEITLNKALNA